MERRALITGISGQDGAYLAKYLLTLGYSITGTTRSPADVPERLQTLGIVDDVTLVETPGPDVVAWQRLLDAVLPSEIYHLAAQTSLSEGAQRPYTTGVINGFVPLSLLEAVRLSLPEARVFFASSAQVFGVNPAGKLGPAGPFAPTNLYGASKLFAQQVGEFYRNSYGLFISHGILFAHESPLRGKEFLSRKVSSTLAAIRLGQSSILEVGNLDSQRDWGYAPDFVRGMHSALQVDVADGYVFATGHSSTVRALITAAGAALDFDFEWSGVGLDEVAIDRNSGRKIVGVNPAFFRSFNEETPVADIELTRKKLDWEPILGLNDIIAEMCVADCEALRGG